MPVATPQHAELLRVIFWLINGLAILLAALALLWGGVMVHVYRRDARRMREGLCMRCGYDLRQATDRCPECGEPMRTARPDKVTRGS